MHAIETPLTPVWRDHGGKIVDFAGYALPLSFAGTLREHAAVRERVGLFDVSHMGQIDIAGDDAAAALEALLPVTLSDATTATGRMRYTFVPTTDGSGILDDVIVTKTDAGVRLVANGARKALVIEHLRALLPAHLNLDVRNDLALLALQGPDAAALLGAEASALKFMHAGEAVLWGTPVRVSRCGYTGEDGFELSLPFAQAVSMVQTLIDAGAQPCGLGARDTLRIEAGLPLYGNELTETTDPVAAGLLRFIPKARRAPFSPPDAVTHVLTGLLPEGKRPVRGGTPLHDAQGQVIGHVTSGTFSPVLNVPVSIGYVDRTASTPYFAGSTPVHAATLPFVPHRYAV